MKIFAADGSELMTVSAIERQGDDLVLKGKVFGTMPMKARLRPEEARAALKLMSPRLAWFVFTMLFRRAKET